MSKPDDIVQAARRRTPLWVRICEALVVLVVLFFVIRALYQQLTQLDWNSIRFDIPLLTISIVGATAGSLLIAIIFAGYFSQLEHPLGARDAIILASLPRLGKFIPGKVHTVFGLVWLAHRLRQVPARASVTVALLISVHFVVVALVTSALLAPFSRLAGLWQLCLAGGALLGLVALHPMFSMGPINWLLKHLGRPAISCRVSYQRLLILAGISIVQKVFMAAMFVLLASAILDIPTQIYAHLALGFVLATISGFIAFFAPAGIGVQEGILFLFLSQVLPSDQAAMLTIAARIWQTFALVLGAGVGALLLARRKSPTSQTSD
jgi:glycosyltransferase 2 family protein